MSTIKEKSLEILTEENRGTRKRPISTPVLIKTIRECVERAERKKDGLRAERELGMSV
jgi:hypothetical protein